MIRNQAKPAQAPVEKVKKVVVKKVKAAKPLAEKVKANTKKTAKAKVAETATTNKGLERLHSHAMKHLNNWHAKAGPDGTEFAKRLAKHAKSLLK